MFYVLQQQCACIILCSTRYKIHYIYFRHGAHSYNTIYVDLNNKKQCITYNDKKYYINFSKI